MATQTQTGGTTTATKEKVRLKPYDKMTKDEKAAYDALSPAKKELYEAKLVRQDAEDKIAEARKHEEAERAEKKAAKERESGIKDIIKGVRSGDIPDTEDATLKPKLKALGVPEADQAAVIERIKQDSVKSTQGRLTPAKPTFNIERKLIKVMKDELVAPTDGGRPDVTLINNVNYLNKLLPLVVRTSADHPDKYVVMDGKRSYWLMPDNEEFEVMLLTGFPDEATAEEAEIALNRVRSLNVLATADTLERMRQRGVKDTDIRKRMGFKTGEIDKITSVINGLSKDMADTLRAGHITPTVAIAIAKLPKNLQAELFKKYKDKLKDNADARISEQDVTDIRQTRAADAAKRDSGMFSQAAAQTGNPEEGKTGK